MKIKVINLLINLANETFNSNVEIKIDEKRTYTLDYYLYVMCGEMQGTYKELNNFLNQDVEVINLSEHIKTILEEEKRIPEKLNLDKDELLKNVIITAQDYVIEGKINEIIDYLKSKGDE